MPGETNSLGLWRYASEYLESSKLVAGTRHLSTPAYYLAAHSIELVLKAFLRGKGSTLEELRDMGHNLSHLLVIANKNDLKSYCDLTEEEQQYIQLLNEYYQRKEFEYIVTGIKHLPTFERLFSITSQLIRSLQDFCIQSQDIQNEDPVA